jgi:predicted metalloprotease with PDZ domain
VANTAPHVKPYTFDEVVATLNQVAPNDWRKFLNDRLTYTGPNAPLGGIEGSGWKLVYNEQEPELIRLRESRGEGVDVSFSLGLLIGKEGRIYDSIFNMPAFAAGVMPGMTLVAVNGRKFTPEVLHDAIKASRGVSQPIQLLIENSDYYRTVEVNYAEGEKYPHLERDSAKPDWLSEMIRAHAK